MPSRERDASMQPRRGFSEPASPPRAGIDQLHAGQLIDRGPHRHEFQWKGPLSRLVALRTDHGVVALWGKRLERALANSMTKPKVDDRIDVREHSCYSLTLVVCKCVDGVVTPERQYDTLRPRWIVELEEFVQRRFAARTLRDRTISRSDAVALSAQPRSRLVLASHYPPCGGERARLPAANGRLGRPSPDVKDQTPS